MNDKKYYLPLIDDDFMNYQPNSKLINAYINTIELSGYIRRKIDLGYIIKYNKDESYYADDEFFTEKLYKARGIFNDYYDIFTKPQLTSDNISDYFKTYFEAIENFTDLLFFLNASNYNDDTKFQCIKYIENKKLKMLIFDKFRIEFEYTSINIDNSLMDILDNKQNVKFIRICNDKRELISFIQGYEPEFNDVASIILFKEIMRITCADIAAMMEDIFASALDFYIIHHKAEAFKSLFLEEGDLYIYDESRKVDNSTPVRRSFWSFRSKNSV